MTTTVPVHCSHTELRPITALKEHPKNVNFHPDIQIGLLAKILVKHGWRSPIVVSDRSGFITKGHGRLDAARRAGLSEVPVEVQHYATEAEEIADMLADNRLPELAHTDGAAASALMEEISKGGFSIEEYGFTAAEFNALTGKDAPAAEASSSSRQPPERIGDQVRQYNIIFDTPEQQQQWFTYLKHLKAKYPECDTIAARISKDVANFNAA